MQFSYQDEYKSFKSTYGQINSWPIPYQYMNWYCALPDDQQLYYLNPNNYCSLYSWSREFQQAQIKQQKPLKLSRGQKRKQKKKALEEEYKKQQGLIGKWILIERKDLVNQLKKIQQKQIKIKQKRQKKLSHLIEIHKQVYKHHLKKKNNSNVKKRTNANSHKNKKKMSIIKKMKQIFQIRNDCQIKNEKVQTKTNSVTNEYKKQLIYAHNIQNKLMIQNYKQKQKSEAEQPEFSKNNKNIQMIQNEQDYQDMTEDEIDKQAEQTQLVETSVPKVSFQIQQIDYKNIGKMAGKNYCDIQLRQWVTNVPNPQLEELTLQLVNRLAYKQAIKKVNKPQKAKKLIVSGIKQTKRTLTTILDNKKSRCLIVALNIQRNNLVKGTDDEIQRCIKLGQQAKIPIIHISTRSKLGRAFTGKFGPRIGIISIVNCQGYQDMMESMLEVWVESCKQYDRIL